MGMTLTVHLAATISGISQLVAPSARGTMVVWDICWHVVDPSMRGFEIECFQAQADICQKSFTINCDTFETYFHLHALQNGCVTLLGTKCVNTTEKRRGTTS